MQISGVSSTSYSYPTTRMSTCASCGSTLASGGVCASCGTGPKLPAPAEPKGITPASSDRLDVTIGATEEEYQELGLTRSETEDGTEEGSEDRGNGSSVGASASSELTEEEKKVVEQMRQRDREVRTHEAAHLAAAGPYARGGARFEYRTGPDGRQYVVDGSVSIDTSPVPNDPAATIRKAQQIRAAALAPATPSAQDRAVAASATQLEAEARSQLAAEAIEESFQAREGSVASPTTPEAAPPDSVAGQPPSADPSRVEPISGEQPSNIRTTEGNPSPSGLPPRSASPSRADGTTPVVNPGRSETPQSFSRFSEPSVGPNATALAYRIESTNRSFSQLA